MFDPSVSQGISRMLFSQSEPEPIARWSGPKPVETYYEQDFFLDKGPFSWFVIFIPFNDFNS
jgi:hypothetical protein